MPENEIKLDYNMAIKCISYGSDFSCINKIEKECNDIGLDNSIKQSASQLLLSKIIEHKIRFSGSLKNSYLCTFSDEEMNFLGNKFDEYQKDKDKFEYYFAPYLKKSGTNEILYIYVFYQNYNPREDSVSFYTDILFDKNDIMELAKDPFYKKFRLGEGNNEKIEKLNKRTEETECLEQVELEIPKGKRGRREREESRIYRLLTILEFKDNPKFREMRPIEKENHIASLYEKNQKFPMGMKPKLEDYKPQTYGITPKRLEKIIADVENEYEEILKNYFDTSN